MLDMLHRSTQQHQCSHPVCYMLPEPPLLAYYLQQLTHAHVELPFVPLYPSIAHSRGHSLSPRAAPSHVHVHMHGPCPHTLLPTSDSHQGTHTERAFPPLSLQPFPYSPFPKHTLVVSHDPCVHMQPALAPRPLWRLSHSQTLPPLSPRCLLHANTYACTQKLTNSLCLVLHGNSSLPRSQH